jgi:ABC-type phosphate transport system substrate-binding protein
MKNAFQSALFALFLIFLPLLIPCQSSAEKTTAEPFSSPAEITPMADEWQKAPVKYPEELAGYELVVNFDQSQSPVLKELVQEWASRNKIKAFVNGGTCGTSNSFLVHKQADLTTFCCPPGAMDRLPGLSFHTLGIAPLALIVHPDNPLTDVTFEEAQKLFSGQTANWVELTSAKGSPDFVNPVQPVIFPHCKKRPGHWRLLLASHEMMSPRAIEVQTIPDMIFTVASNKRAVGLEIFSLLDRYRAEKGAVKMLSLDGISPTDLAQAGKGDYPLYRSHTLAFWGAPSLQNKHVQELIDYLDRYIQENQKRLGIVPAADLKRNGWRFQGEELIGAPRQPGNNNPEPLPPPR